MGQPPPGEQQPGHGHGHHHDQEQRHGHGHSHGDSHGHEHDHEHGHGHHHDHDHGHEHSHDHEHEHGHEDHHDHGHDDEHLHVDPAQLKVRRVAARLVLCMLLGLGLLWQWDAERAAYATKIFLGITLEAAPWILAAAVLTLIMEAILRDDWLPRLAARYGWFGLPLVCVAAPFIPTCECGVVVVLRGLLRKGLPMPHAITFLLIAPILNPLVLLSTWVAFADWSMALWRGGLAIVVAVAVGSIFWRLTPAQALCHGGGHDHGHHHAKRLAQRAERVLGDVFDTFLIFLFGVGLATALRVLVPVSTLDGVASDPFIAPAVTMTLAFVASLCSEADAFLAAGLHGFTAAALLAFLIFGPMCDIKLLLMLRTVLKPMIIAKVMGCTAVLVYMAALVAHLFV